MVQAVFAKDRRMSVRMTAGHTVNHAFYKDVLERLRRRVQRVRTDIAYRASSHCAFNSRISGKEKHPHTSTSSLQPRYSSVLFLPLLEVEIEVERSSFRDDGKHTKSCNR